MEPTRILQRACRHMAESNDARRRQADCIPRNARRNGNSRYDSSLQGGRLTGIGGRVIQLGNGQIALGDCLDVMRSVPSASVDMILCDLPYGTTQNKWDSVIPFAPLWSEYWRIAKPNAAVVLTADQPFTSALVMSQIDRFRYNWHWDKVQATGFLNVKKMPLKSVEDVLIFYRELPVYNPEMRTGPARKRTPSRKPESTNYREGLHQTGIYAEQSSDETRYPNTLLTISKGQGPNSRPIHPTQKPVALFEYLIRTYTNEGDTVMDNCLGSGTTAIAAENTGRRWIGIERDLTYFGLACDRIARAVNA